MFSIGKVRLFVLVALFALISSPSHAAGASSISPADTVWVLISTALVMLMTPGLGLFTEEWFAERTSLQPFFRVSA